MNPSIPKSCFIAPQAIVIGDVVLGENSSVWFNTVIRGDVNTIRIGKMTNIQDLSMVHVANADGPSPAPTVIGDYVTVGHRAIIHGATVQDNCLIGMGAILLDRSVIGKNSIIGAGALVTEGMNIPPGSLAFGSPAKVIRLLTEAEISLIRFSAENYAALAEKYKKS
ncbi:MAG: gamma carbonic anhydrase family protein [Deltaproteobacteria bacterium]|nr:gamma carbonic anhydrase family protein [Deltaproteobacteria bacterium]